jgi:hypothetical protein
MSGVDGHHPAVTTATRMQIDAENAPFRRHRFQFRQWNEEAAGP